jgi:hypothetical protein
MVWHSGSLLVEPSDMPAKLPRSYASTFDAFSRAVPLPEVEPLPCPAAVAAPSTWPESESLAVLAGDSWHRFVVILCAALITLALPVLITRALCVVGVLQS